MIKISNNVYILLNLHTIPFRVPDAHTHTHTHTQIYIYIYKAISKNKQGFL